MKFTSKSDMDAPIEKVFEVVSDFDQVERAAARRSVEVTRVEDRTPPAPGMAWDAGFRFRGKSRTARVSLQSISAPEAMEFHTVTGGLETEVALEFVALSPSKTRMIITAEMKPKTLSARLLVQSLKLAKGNMDKRFDKRFAELSKVVEGRANGSDG